MPLLLLLLILLAFPVLEVVLLVHLGERYGWGLLGYLLLSAALGWRLIQNERRGAFARMAEALQTGQQPIRSLLNSAKNFVAGILLILPGVLSDLLAILILLIPSPRLRQPSPPPTQDDAHVVEGEWRRED